MTDTISLREIQHDIRAAGRQVWLASLGAVASVEDGSNRLWEQMKSWSDEMEERRREKAAAKVEENAERPADVVDEPARKAETKAAAWAAELLHRFDLPTRRDFDVLEERIHELGTVVVAWRAGKPAGEQPAAEKTVAEKPAAEKPTPASLGRKVLHVEPHEDGWQIAVEGTPRYERLESTKKAAVAAARKIARRHLPSELVIHRQDGSVQTRSSYDEEAAP